MRRIAGQALDALGKRKRDIGNLGAQRWNTGPPINQHGDVVGFAGDPAFVEGDILHAFMWTKEDGIRHLKPLQKHHYRM